MRVYIPATFEDIQSPVLQVSTGVAVTSAFCEQFLEENDLEFLEDCAFTQASFLSFMKLQSNNVSIKARFVISADISDEDCLEDSNFPGKVSIEKPISWDNIACIHAEDIEEIFNIIKLLSKGEEEVESEIDTIPLLWFDKSERPTLIDMFKGL